MVLLDEPTFPLSHTGQTHLRVLDVGREGSRRQGSRRAPRANPRWDGIIDIADLPEHALDEIAHFFDVYKELEPGKGTETREWRGRADAERVIREARAR